MLDIGATTANIGATTAPTACPSCTPVSFLSPRCYATINDPPELGEFKIFNNEDIEVEVDMVDIGGSKNHICQSEFNGSRQLIFWAEVSDPDGNSVTGVLTLNGKVIPVLNGVSTGISNPLTFGWTGGEFIPTDYNNSNTSELILTLSDSNYSKPFSPRSFKIWDCQMPISGSFYDATEAADNDLFDFCPTDGFTKIVEDRNVLNFTSLRFKEPDANDDESIAMTVNPSGVDYGSASNYLIWGKEYEVNFNPDISLTRWEMRYNGICSNTTLKTSNIDPYPSDTSIIADFTGILIQDPWWQTSEGGVVSNNSVSGKVPVTCTEENTCDDNMSINAFVIAPTIEKKSDQDKYLMQNSAKIANPTTNNYEYFFKQYYAKKGIGETIGTEGEKVIINDSVTQLFSNPSDTYIYFVNGDLEINDNIVRNSSFLMFIVKGNVTVNANVNRVDGLIVASNIYASSTQNTATNNQLVFNGSLFAYDNISFTRGYADRIWQNEKASVLIKYDPQLIFKIPGSLAKVLTSWQWGN